MNNKTTNIKRILFRAIIASLSGLSIIAGGISFSKNLSCSDPYLQAYFEKHPENITVTITPEIANTMYNLNLQKAQQLAAQWGTTVVAPDYNSSVLSVLQGQVNMYQKYIDSLQLQYQNAMATGNVAYAQQCLNLINVWNAKKAEATNQLNRFLLTMPK